MDFNKISVKITILLLFSILLIGVLIGSQYFALRTVLKDEVLSHLSDLSVTTANNLNTFLELMKGRMIDFSSDGKIKDCLYYINNNSPECTKEMLTQHLTKNKLPAIETLIEVSAINPNGEVIASTTKSEIGTDKSSEDIYTLGKQKARISDIKYYEPLSQNMIAISSPVMREGTLVGVIVGRIKPDQLFDILSKATNTSEGKETYLVGKDLIARSPLLFSQDSVLKKTINTELSKACAKSSIYDTRPQKKPLTYTNYANRHTIGAYILIKEPEWCLLSEQDEAIVFNAPNRLIKTTTIISLITLLLISLIISYYTKNNLLKPIHELYKTTEKLEKGDFSTKVNIRTKDELEKLGKTFNRAIASLNETETERNQLDKAKTEFLAVVSHELRSPMTPMKAQLQMLKTGYQGRVNPKQKASIDIIIRNADRLDKLIVDLLDISKIETTQLKFNLRETDLNKLILENTDYLKQLLPDKKLKITTRLAVLPKIQIDPDRVSQVLRNTIGNAIKFSNPHGKIHIETEKKKGHIEVRVTDTGIGIPDEQQKGLFTPFYQIENSLSRKYGGAGLGLAISKGIIELQGGNIWLRSAPNKGTTIHFTIPIKPTNGKTTAGLFLPRQVIIEQNIEKAFKSFLGPAGKYEFEKLKENNAINPKGISKYLRSLIAKHIITRETYRQLESETNRIFKDKK